MMNDTSNPVATAHSLLQQGRIADAIATIRRGAAAGHIEAWYQLGLWQLIGYPIPRDLPAARQALSRAMQGGHTDATMMTIALTANGSGGRADWSTALGLLQNEARRNAHAATVLNLVEALRLNPEGQPTQTCRRVPLVADASIYHVPNFLSPAECDHIAQAGQDLFEPALVVDSATGRHIPHPIRTSDAAVIGPVREDLAIRSINQRIAAVTDTLIDQGEALTLLRYQPSQQFRLHSDAIAGARNQRVTTAILYLNDEFTGGETHFPHYDLRIAPRRGDALFFRNVLQNGRPDPKASHAGLPVTKGVKWIATRWIRANSFSQWDGPE